MKSNIFKSWKTSLIGLVVLAVYAYSVISNGQTVDLTSIPSVLVALGLLAAKDGDQTHSGNKSRYSRNAAIVEGPDPNKEEK